MSPPLASVQSQPNPRAATNMPPPPPQLMEELVEEILLRLPPHEPARSTARCKQWCRLVSAPSFGSRFRAFHRSPPMLGFLLNAANTGASGLVARFVPTAASCALLPDGRRRRAQDARHGRVLLRLLNRQGRMGVLAVWDPVTDELRDFPSPARRGEIWTVAVLCAGAAAGDCDHLDCHRGPFLVVFVGSHGWETFICTYSSHVAAWSEPVSTQSPIGSFVDPFMPGALVGNALYFGFRMTDTALKYDLQLRQTSLIQLPALESSWPPCPYVFTATECGGLGIATIRGSKLYMWSRNAAPEGDAGWTQSRAIELERPLPVSVDAIVPSPEVVGIADGVGIIFYRANDVLYTIDVKTYKVKKVYEGRTVGSILPYMSFYTAALGAAYTDDGPSASGSSA